MPPEGISQESPRLSDNHKPGSGKNQYYIFQTNTENFEESILPEKHSCLGRLLMLLLATERENLLYEEDSSDHRNNTDHRRIIMVAVWFKIRK